MATWRSLARIGQQPEPNQNVPYLYPSQCSVPNSVTSHKILEISKEWANSVAWLKILLYAENSDP